MYRGAFGVDVVDFQQAVGTEGKDAGDDVGGELLHGVVVVGDAVVVVLAREGNAVLGRGDFFAQGGKLVVRFELRVVLKGGVKAAEARAKGLFGSGKFADARRAAAGVF